MADIPDPRRAGENWSGITDPKRRRKLQNRLNVRAHRLRKNNIRCSNDARAFEPGTAQRDVSVRGSRIPTIVFRSRNDSQPSNSHFRIVSPGSDTPYLMEIESLLTCRCDLVPPKPGEDSLISVAQFNLVRGFTTNALILNILHLFPSLDCKPISGGMPLFPNPYLESTFSKSVVGSSVGNTPKLPPCLDRTELQLKTPHELWIDVLPDPVFRDNIIKRLGNNPLGLAELHADLVGSVCPNVMTVLQRHQIKLPPEARRRLVDDREPGMVVWNTPWSIDGYEITPRLARKWGFLFQGCDALLGATNSWRLQRGERPLPSQVIKGE